MSNRALSVIKFIFGWPLSLIAIFFVSRLILSQADSISSFIKVPNLFLLIPGILLLSFYFFLRSYVWKLLLDQKGHSIALREASYLWAVAEFKRYSPGFIWAFVSKTLSFGEKGIEKKTIANLILLEISFFMLGTIVTSLLATSFIFSSLIPQMSYINLPIIALTFLACAIFILNQSILSKLKLLSKFKFLKLMLPDFNPYTNFKLAVISVFSHFIFGLGTYFVISSISYLPIEKSLAFVGLFTFSLLVGYLSIIAPMGLGVREGFMTLALSKVLSVQEAGFASIFARIIFVLSEMLFLLFVFSWRNLKYNFISKIEEFVKKYPHEIFLGIAIGIYIIYFTTLSFLRHDNFFTGRFDLGNMDQVVWNTISGRVFEFTNPDSLNVVSRLSFHADFLLIFLSPLYLIWSDPKMLLLFQTIILALGSIFIYLISKSILKNNNISLILSISYLLNPSVQFTNLYDFHPVVSATTFLLGAFYFLQKNKYAWFLLFLFLSVISKEQLWVISAIFGLHIIFFKKQKLLGSTLVLGSLAVFYLLVSHIIPRIHGGEHFAVSYYSEFGDSPAGIIKNVIFSPLLTISTLLSENSLVYLYKLFLHVGFLPLVNPLILLFALPDLAINLLSSNPQFKQLYYQYTAVITPFIFISSIYSIKFLRRKFGNISLNFFSWYVIVFALVSAYYYGPLPFAKNPSISVFTHQLGYRDEVKQALMLIPDDVKVSASNNLGAHLTHRDYLFTIPMGVEEADYIALLLTDNFAQPSLTFQKELAQNLSNNPRYEVIYKKNEFIIFKRLD